MRKLRLLAALLAMLVVMVVAASGPAMAQDHWWWGDDDESDSRGDEPDSWDAPWWIGSDDGTGADWEYASDYGWYPEELSWEGDGYLYEVEYVPCGDDLCIDDIDRAALS